MKIRFHLGLAVIFAVACLIPAAAPASNTNVHTSFHWHLHQPIYWPDRRDYGTDHYEAAWDTIQQQNAGRPTPYPEVLSSIFGESDRVNAYQVSPHDALSSILSYPNAGASVSFSGALIENVQSLGAAGQLGYSSTWNHDNQQARGWTTSGGHPRMDLVNFTYHHALAPLISPETLQMELLIQQRQMQIFWGATPAQSRGYFPAETCFASYMIPTLQKVGIQWSIIANNHLARACADFPVVLGSGGENCDLPNLADQLNPAQGTGNYQRISIARGCAPTQVMPFGFQVHYARYVDPQTGVGSNLVVVPSDQAFGWDDSYSTWDLGQLAPLAARNNPAKPALALFAHDGDNAWSGGYSYYYEWVNQCASQASGLGYEPTTIEQFLQDFPPATNDVVHVESGGWVFADGDFGSPMFINWHWPPSYSSNGTNVVDPSLGVSDKADNWRVIIATENRVKTAQQIAGVTPDIDQIRDPGSFSGTPKPVELGWHYYLASLDSGFVYYGCTGGECQRAIVAQSNAVRNIDPILSANPAADTTPPTVFIPQRHPWNPGGTNYGVQYGYKLAVEQNSDFWIWTYAYDMSGITNVSLLYRINGANPPVSDEFQTYLGGADTGAWITSNMTLRIVAPTVGMTPQYIADYYYSKVTGISNAYVDYYVSATDSRGNTSKSPIQHVYVGAGSGGGGSSGGNGTGCDGRVCVVPAAPLAGSQVTIQYTPAGGPIASATTVNIHLGWNGWNPVVSPDPAMMFLSASNFWQYTVAIPSTATQLNCVFNNGSGTWDNNNGGNWNFSVTANTNPVVPSQPQNLAATPVATNQINLAWAAAASATSYIVNRNDAPVGVTSGTTYSDTNLATNISYCYSIVASNNVGYSTPSATVCTNTLTASSGGGGIECNGRVCLMPAVPVAGSPVTIQYTPAGGPIASATTADIHLGFNGWNPTITPDPAMTFLSASNLWQYSATIPSTATVLNCAFNNGSGTWDNNSTSNWNFSVTGSTITNTNSIPAFLVNGAFAYPGYQLASNSTMVLYAALRGTILYVATGSPGTSGPNDYFIFVTDQLLASATNPAPWAKSGLVAVSANKPYLATESQGTYISWYLNGSATSYPCAKSATTSGAMTGTVDLMAAFGYIPTNIYLCAAAYATADGGALVGQCPAGSGPNLNPGGFLEIPTAALSDSNGSGVFDRLDPARGFVLLGASLANGVGLTLNWASMPGHGYQVVYRNDLNNPWSNLPGASNVAGPMQIILSYTDPAPTNAAARFYGIKLTQ